ncbi:MAG: efflux RND transporter periplasmic adaptor subunit [Alphaproteobacteria bacterium]
MGNTRIRQALFVLVIAAVGILGFWWFFFSTPPATYEIQTVELSRGSIERSISATGAVEALVTVDVSSQLSGQISNVNVDFNSPVKKNAILAVIDPRTFAARVASAEAALAIAKTNVALEEASVAKAKALLAQAESNVARHKKLAPIKATPAATLEAAETEAATAKADLQVAEAKLDNARANVKKGEADLSQAKLDLDRTQIRSPINGVVIARNVDPGGTVAASLQAPVLFQIAQDLKQVQILVLVDEADIGSIKTKQPVTFTVDAFPDRVFSGKVAQVRIAGDTSSNVVTYTVVVRAQNPQQKLLPGMTATVRIITGTRRDVLRVPNEAVRFLPPNGVKTTKPAKRPNRDEAIVTRLSEKLGLSAEQTEKFREGMAAARQMREQRANASRKNGAKDNETSTRVPARRSARTKRRTSRNTSARRGRITRVLEGILTPKQMKAFKVLHEEWRDATTPANVWTETPNGLQPHRLILGLTDDSFSEILRGTLKKGDRVVTRARRNGGGENQRGRRGSR